MPGARQGFSRVKIPIGESQCCAAPPIGSEDSAVEARPKVTWVSFSIRGSAGYRIPSAVRVSSKKLKTLEKKRLFGGHLLD